MKSALNEKWIVCRICLKQPKHETMHAIFNNSEEKDMTQMILECGGVPIKKYDHYPDKICAKCLKYLRVAYKFRVVCQRSHKHLSRFIAPVEVEKLDGTAIPVVSLQLDDGEEIPLKMEPDETMNIKHELSEEDAGVVDVYEPMDDEMLTLEDVEAEEIGSPETLESDEIEFLDDIGDELSTSDEEFIPTSEKKSTKGPKKSPKQKPTTSRYASASKKSAQPKKQVRTRKPKQSSYICDMCGNIYPSQGRLTEHIKLHKGIKPHECEICGHAFAQTQQLARHMNTHTGNRPYKCSYCPAAFADLSTRNKHHRIHTNERPYVCDVCGKSFTYTNTLKFHKMIHTGEKPHVCDICGKGFQQAYKLRNHKMTHEKKGIKLEKLEVETLNTMQEVNAATAHLLEI